MTAQHKTGCIKIICNIWYEKFSIATPPGFLFPHAGVEAKLLDQRAAWMRVVCLTA